MLSKASVFILCFRKVKVCLYFPKNICGYISVWGKAVMTYKLELLFVFFFLQDDKVFLDEG